MIKDLKKLEKIKKKCSTCTKCELSKNRTNSVFSDGNPNASIMLIGEAPGANEDKEGKPFVGRAGKFLDSLLQEGGVIRENDIYICNTVKCRPPENRVPTNFEKECCREYLDAQIDIIKPKVIILCGATSMKSFIDTKLGITKIRGQWFDAPNDAKFMPILHPSYLLRNRSREEGKPISLTLQDIREVKKIVEF